MIQTIHDNDTYAVTTQGLTRRFGDTMALDNVELRVPEGAVYVLAGANGAGKSTAMNVLMNLVRADAGTARVLGMDTASQGPLVRAHIGYVPEHQRHRYGWLKCGQLIAHVSAYFRSWDATYADHLARVFKLRLDRDAGTLSKGEARRLQLLLALAHRPALLLLDEPTDGLDPVVRKRTLTLLAEHLADTPTTVLISTHRMYEVESLADHVGVLRDGKLVAQLSRDQLQRTVRRYRIDVPEGWQMPADLSPTMLRRSKGGREVECTLIGEEAVVIARIAQSQAQVRDVGALSFEDASLAFLSDEEEVS